MSSNEPKTNDFKVILPMSIKRHKCYVLESSLPDDKNIKVKCQYCPLSRLSINPHDCNPYRSLYMHLKSKTHTQNSPRLLEIDTNLNKKVISSKFNRNMFKRNKLAKKLTKYISKHELPIGLRRHNCFKFDDSIPLSCRYHKITCDLCQMSSIKIDTLYKNPFSNVYKHLNSKMHQLNASKNRQELKKQTESRFSTQNDNDQFKLTICKLNLELRQADLKEELKLREKEYLVKINEIQHEEINHLKEILVNSFDKSKSKALNDKFILLENENKQLEMNKLIINNEYLTIQNKIRQYENKKDSVKNENEDLKAKLDRFKSFIQNISKKIEISHDNFNKDSFRSNLKNKIQLLNLENKILRDESKTLGQSKIKHEQFSEQANQMNNYNPNKDQVDCIFID